MKEFIFSSFIQDINKKGLSSDYMGIKHENTNKTSKKSKIFRSLAEEDLEKYRQIINDPEALISIDDPLGISRNLCMLCKLDCKSYKPAHSYIHNNNNISPSNCLNCGCGASNHLPTEFEFKKLPKEIIKVLYNNDFTNENLNFNGILVVFSIEDATNIEISNFLKLLKEAGFNIVGTKIDNILEKDSDILTDNIEKYYNDLVNGKSEFSKLVLKDATIKTLNMPKRKDKKFVEHSKTVSVPKKKNTKIDYLDTFINPVLSVCLQTKPRRGDSSISYFEEVYFSTRKLVSSKIGLVYYSKSKINALWDLQILFPDIFKVCSYISIITEKNNFFHKDSRTSKNQEEIKEFNKFFLKTKENKFEKMHNMEEENKRKIDAIQTLKSSQFIAEKIRNSTLINSQLNPAEKSTNTLSAIPNIISNVFFKSARNEEEKKERTKEKISKRKTIFPMQFYENNNLEESEEDEIVEEAEEQENNLSTLKERSKTKDNFENLEIKSKSTKEREHEFYKNLSMFKDNLSLNSCVLNDEIIFNSKQKIMQLCKKYRENTYINNFCKFILNNSFADNINKYNDILLISKVGPSISVNPLGVDYNFDVVNITKTKDFNILSNLFFEDMVSYSKVLIVFRPMIVRCGLNDVIINIFKINGFNILKRKFTKLQLPDAKFLFNFEGLDQNFLDDYIKIMIESEVEVLCISKFGAMQESKILCDGALDGNLNFNYSILDKIDLKVEYEVKNDLIHDDDILKKRKYEKLVDLNTSANENHLLFENIFSAISELIDIDYILDLIVENDILKLNLLSKDDKRRTEMYNLVQDYQLFSKINEIRANLLQFCRVFNMCMYNSRDQKLVEREIAYFFSELYDMQEVILIIKPVSQEVSQMIKLTLERMKFEVVKVASYKINEVAFNFLFDQFFKTMSTQEYEQVRIDFVINELEVIRMIKPGGNIEIEAIIGKSNELTFLIVEDIDNELTTDYNKLLKRHCYHAKISKDIEFLYDVVEPRLAVIEGSFLLNNKNIIHDIINSCLKSTIGESLRKDENIQEKLLYRYIMFYNYDDTSKINDYFSEVLNNYMISTWKISSNILNKHYNKFFEFLLFKNDVLNHQLGFLVESTNLGFYEVRIPIFKHSVPSLIDVDIDMVQINIARNYPFYDMSFFNNLEKIYKNDKIVCEVHEFFDLFFYDTNQLVKDASDYNLKFSLQLKQFDLINTDEALYDSRAGLTEAFNIISKKSITNEENLSFNNSDISIQEIKYKVIETLKSIKARVYYKTKYESNLFFYKLACKNELNCTPNNYHFRIKPDDIHCKIRRIFEVEEFSGLYFIDVVSQDYMKYRPPEKDSQTYRFSLSGFLWGKRLSNLCKSFEKMKSDEISNCGPLIYSKDGKLKGIINPKYFIEYETFLYLNILKDLKEVNNKSLLDNKFINDNNFEALNKKLLLILNSEAFKMSRKEENLVLIPTRLLDFNIRISKKHDKNTVIDVDDGKGIKTLDPDHELNFHQFFKENERIHLKDIALKNLVLVDILWNKHTKFRLYGMFEWLLKINYMKLHRKSYLLNNNEDDYDKMIEAILEGFYKFMIIDKYNDKDEFNIYKVEYFLVGLLELKYLLNDLSLFKNYHNTVTKKKQHFFDKQKKNVSKENIEIINELEQVQHMLENTLNVINMDLEIIFFELLEFDFKYKQETSKISSEKYIFLPKERYHIPMHINERKVEIGDVERYTVVEKIDDRPYKIDLKTLSRINTKIGTNKIVFDDPIIRTKNLLRNLPEKKDDFIKILKSHRISNRVMNRLIFWMRRHVYTYIMKEQMKKLRTQKNERI